MKCCANGCGTNCIQPIKMTVCEHLRAILIHNAHEVGIPAKDIYIPQCRKKDGRFEVVQCSKRKGCWCVDDGPKERDSLEKSYCGGTSVCKNEYSCDTHCEHGYPIDSVGCPHCKCKDLCEELKCHEEGEECSMAEISCTDKPQAHVPVCIPVKEKLCKFGHPLLNHKTNETVKCGPDVQPCPSSHKCQLSPIMSYGVCCLKPRDVCLLPKEEGKCSTSQARWHFNTENKLCEEFTFKGCKGNQNNFESEEMCKTVCQVLSNCERVRERNRQQAESYKKPMFIPRCDSNTGLYLPVQCLEHVGMCWCSDPEGKPINGTFAKGPPLSCS